MLLNVYAHVFGCMDRQMQPIVSMIIHTMCIYLNQWITELEN